MDVADFRLQAEDFWYVGTDLSRPECVLTMPDGTLWVSDDRSAICRIDPDGRQERIGSMRGAPNGIAMDRNGGIYIANIQDGRVYRFDPDGRQEVVLDQIDGQPLGSPNFPYIDAHDRLWITVSTVTHPRSKAKSEGTGDGYILLVEDGVPRRVATGFMFTNEIRIDPGEHHLYVSETSAGRISRHRLSADGSLGERGTFGPEPLIPGAATDGIAFDADGNLWVTELTRNALIVISPRGEASTVFEDPTGAVIDAPTSLAFGGEDLTTVYVGSLTMDRLAAFASPVPGAPMRHWH